MSQCHRRKEAKGIELAKRETLNRRISKRGSGSTSGEHLYIQISTNEIRGNLEERDDYVVTSDASTSSTIGTHCYNVTTVVVACIG